jgi:hypothetical protein
MHPPAASVVRRALREPTVHFAILAVLLFAAGAVAKSLQRPVVDIDPRFVELRVRQLERAKGAALDPAERQQAEAAYVEEQILAAEARARGLDDDERIRALLHQKMLHVLAGDVPPPTDAELTAYFEQHRDRYARRPTVTVEDVVVAEPPRAMLRPARLDDGPIEPPPGARRSVLTRVTEGELAWAFGDETAARVMGAAVGSWTGPHASATGEHWFRVIERSIGTDAPSLDAIRDQVRYDWMAQAEDVLLQQRVAAIRGRYAVRVGANGAAR